MTRARAAVLEAPRTITLREFDAPDTGADGGVLRVEACGVCGADWLPYIGAREISGTGVILGHEIVGIVTAIAPSAAARWGVSVGDRVVLEEPIPCGTCRSCLAGRYQMCGEARYGGKSVDIAPSLWGGYSEIVYLDPRARVHKVPTRIEAELVPLFVPVSNGIYWVSEIGACRPGDTVVIEGPGQHGLGCVVGAKEAGAGTVIVTGLAGSDELRLDVAKALGADHVVRIGAEDPVTRVRELTDGQMADVVIQAADRSPEAFDLSVELAGERATIVEAGNVMGRTKNFDPDAIMHKELTIRGVQGRYGQAIEDAIGILDAGRYPLGLLATHSFSLGRTDAALRTMGREVGADALHVTVVPE